MEKLENVEINEFIKAMKKNLGTEQKKNFGKALQIEQDLRKNAVTLEKLAMSTLTHMRKTEERGYISNFLHALQKHVESQLSATHDEVERIEKKRAA